MSWHFVAPGPLTDNDTLARALLEPHILPVKARLDEMLVPERHLVYQSGQIHCGAI